MTVNEKLAAQSLPDWRAALQRLAGAYAENTIRAYRGDFADFGGGCDEQGVTALPTEAETLVAYLEARAATHTPATISRRLAGIGRVHRLLGYDNPTRVDAVALALNGSSGERDGDSAKPQACLLLCGTNCCRLAERTCGFFFKKLCHFKRQMLLERDTGSWHIGVLNIAL